MAWTFDTRGTGAFYHKRGAVAALVAEMCGGERQARVDLAKSLHQKAREKHRRGGKKGGADA